MKGKMRLFIAWLALEVTIGAAAEPFPAEKLTGTWRMSKTFTIEVDPGKGTPTETEQRLTITIEFLGGNRCKATIGNVVLDRETTSIFDYSYSNGEIVFLKIDGHENRQLRDRMFGLTKASRFDLVRKDDNAFEMRYADLATLSRNWAAVGEGRVEYLPNGNLKGITTIVAAGATIKMTELHPPMVFKRISAGGGEKSTPKYDIVSFGRNGESEFTYLFKLKIDGRSGAMPLPQGIMEELRAYIVDDYAESYSDVDVATLFVDFSATGTTDGCVEGRASVVEVGVSAFSYSPQTRLGRMTVRFAPGQEVEARAYLRRNIAAIVRDKNIALVTGDVPPDAAVHIDGEREKGDGSIEVVFRTVE